jgi:N4-gp56 family major capsid protein
MITYETNAERIGKWKADILMHAVPKEILAVGGPMTKDIPKNNSDTMVFRRWLPYGGVDNRWIEGATTDASSTYTAGHIVTEGVTPTADTIAPVDITVVLQQYGMLYSFTDKTFDMYEDDIPAAITKQLGSRMGLLQEMIDYNALKACTNKFYGGGGSTRVSVDKAITLTGLRNIARNLYLNHAEMITSVIAPSANYDTSAIEAAYVVAVSTDALADVRSLPGYVPVEKYGQRKSIHVCEKGSCEEFRFVASPELVPILGAGAAVGTTGLLADDATNIDVYPCIVMAEEAWGKMRLRGTRGFTPYFHGVNKADKSDALGQRGYYGAKMYGASSVLNNGWMAVYEVGVSALDDSV